MVMKFAVALMLFFSCIAFAEDSTFLDGVKAYQEKDYEKAQGLFKELSAEHPGNPAVLFNLGLAEYHKGNFGLALGLWRKARSLDGGFTPAQMAIDYAEGELFPDDHPPMFLLGFVYWLLNLPLHLWITLSLISFFLLGWFSIEYGAKRQKPLTQWPIWLYLTAPVFLVAICFTSFSYLDSLKVRATVITKNLLTHTNPSESSPTLSELQEGQVVFIEKEIGEWVQIRTKEGNPGWVSKNSLIAFRR